jgi:hypothetical protein
MTALGRIWRFLSNGAGADGAASGIRAAGRSDAAALRLYSLPRGVRQRPKYCPLQA